MHIELNMHIHKIYSIEHKADTRQFFLFKKKNLKKFTHQKIEVINSTIIRNHLDKLNQQIDQHFTSNKNVYPHPFPGTQSSKLINVNGLLGQSPNSF